jgi:hypothetical protein
VNFSLDGSTNIFPKKCSLASLPKILSKHTTATPAVHMDPKYECVAHCTLKEERSGEWTKQPYAPLSYESSCQAQPRSSPVK